MEKYTEGRTSYQPGLECSNGRKKIMGRARLNMFNECSGDGDEEVFSGGKEYEAE